MKKKVFITGGTGYVGSEAIQAFLGANYEVRALVRHQERAKQLPHAVYPVVGNLEEPGRWLRQAASCEVLINAAFPSHGQQWPQAVQAEYDYLQFLFSHLDNPDCKVLLLNGTAFLGDSREGRLDEQAPVQSQHPAAIRAVNTNPRHWQSVHLNVIELRLASFIYGKNGSVFLPILKASALKNGTSVYVDEGKVYTSTLDIKAAGQACLLAAEKGRAGESYHFAGDEEPSIKSIARALAQGIGPHCKTLSVSPEEASQILDPFTALFLQQNNRLNSQKARTELGWTGATTTPLLWDLAFGSYAQSNI